MQTPYRKAGKYALQSNDPYLSQDKFLDLQRELDKLLKKRPFVASEVSRLTELGDFSRIPAGIVINFADGLVEKKIHPAFLSPPPSPLN